MEIWYICSMENEKWVPVEGTKGMYEISNLGRVRSFYKKGGIKRTKIKKTGYEHVRIVINGVQKEVRVHRLVASAFLDNWMDLPEVNHLNFIKSDNRAENLEWVTGEQNMLHAAKHNKLGRPISTRSLKKTDKSWHRGSKNPMSKLKQDQVDRIKLEYARENISQTKLGIRHGLSPSHINKILRGNLWKYS